MSAGTGSTHEQPNLSCPPEFLKNLKPWSLGLKEDEHMSALLLLSQEEGLTLNNTGILSSTIF